jgi:hypothetical protein
VQLFTARRGSKISSGLTRSGRGRFARDVARAPGVTMKSETFMVASLETLVPDPTIPAQAARGAAHLAIKEKLGRGARAHRAQVVPSHETEAAA